MTRIVCGHCGWWTEVEDAAKVIGVPKHSCFPGKRINELQERVDALEKRVVELEAKIQGKVTP